MLSAQFKSKKRQMKSRLGIFGTTYCRFMVGEVNNINFVTTKESKIYHYSSVYLSCIEDEKVFRLGKVTTSFF